MQKYRNVRVSEETWRKLKQMALDEGTTLHAIVEREMAGIRIPASNHPWFRKSADSGYGLKPEAVRELTYEPEK